MKKIVITMALAALASTSYGQGYVSVTGTAQNQTNGTVITSAWTGGFLASGGASLGNIASGQAYDLVLLSTTAATPVTTLWGDSTLAADWLDTGLLGHNNGFTGRLVIGGTLQALNAPVGVSQSWVLVGWSTSLGTSWAAVEPLLAAGNFGAAAGFIGWSVTGVGAAGPVAPGLPLIIQGTGGIIPNTPYTLLETPSVPEPATLALVGLGGLALLAFRRK